MIKKQKITLILITVAVTIGVSLAFFSVSAFAQTGTGLFDPETGDQIMSEEEDGNGNKEEGEPDCQPGEDGCCGGVKTSIIGGDICGDNTSDSLIFELLLWVLRIMTAGVGIAAVGGIGYGALLYTTAEGKPDQTKKAIGIITNVVIGIGAYAFMAIILNFLIPGGVFG